MRTLAIFSAVIFAIIFLMQGVALGATYSEQDLVEDRCRQMETAYESLDFDAAVALYHNLSPRGVEMLRRLFEDSKSLNVELEFKQINQTNTEAIALMTRLNLVHKWCGRKLESQPRQEMHLRKIEGTWKFVTPEYARKLAAAR